jgi:hypothetical protein
MTGRELRLWLVVGVVIAAGLVYNLVTPFLVRMEEQKASTGSWDEAARILRAEGNIRARNRAVQERYRQLQTQFYLTKQNNAAELELLGVIEDIAANCGLGIRLKNTLQISPDEIGVALEGTTGSEMLYRFLQRLTETSAGIQIKILELHATPEKRELDYQVVIGALLLK